MSTCTLLRRVLAVVAAVGLAGCPATSPSNPATTPSAPGTAAARKAAAGKAKPTHAPRALRGAGDAKAAALVAKLRRALAGLRSYRARLVTRSRPRSVKVPKTLNSKTTVDLAVALPSRMAMSITASGPGSPWTMRVAYDGATMLTDVRKVGQVQLMRLDQRKLAPRGGFDTGWSAYGHGLARGEDLVGTLRGMLRMFRFTAAPKARPASKAGPACLELTSEQLDHPGAVGLLLDQRTTYAALLGLAGKPVPTKRIERYARSMARMLATMGVVKLCVDARSGLPRRFSLHGEHLLLDTTISGLAQVTHPASTFRHDKAKLAKARDVTAQVAAGLKGTGALMADQGLRSRLREALLRELKSPTAPTLGGPVQLPPQKKKKGP
jgi:hypothetical protein